MKFKVLANSSVTFISISSNNRKPKHIRRFRLNFIKYTRLRYYQYKDLSNQHISHKYTRNERDQTVVFME